MSNQQYYGAPLEKPSPAYQAQGQGHWQQPNGYAPQYIGQPQYYTQPQPQPQPQMVYVQQPPRKDDSGCCTPCACLAGCCAGVLCCPCFLCC